MTFMPIEVARLYVPMRIPEGVKSTECRSDLRYGAERIIQVCLGESIGDGLCHRHR